MFSLFPQSSIISWKDPLNCHCNQICHSMPYTRLVEMSSYWMVSFFLSDCSSMFLYSITKSSACLSNIKEVRAFSTHKLVDDIWCSATHRGFYVPGSASPVTSMGGSFDTGCTQDTHRSIAFAKTILVSGRPPFGVNLGLN